MAPHSDDRLLALFTVLRAAFVSATRLYSRVAVGLCLGIKICEAHSCSCGQFFDVLGTHSRSRKRASGRSSRHHNPNDFVTRDLTVDRAGIPVQKEPLGLVRTDGKRSDGVTLIPWRDGGCLTWDVTVVNSVASSYVTLCQRQLAATAAAVAAARHES
jgi:hypothetical protein